MIDRLLSRIMIFVVCTPSLLAVEPDEKDLCYAIVREKSLLLDFYKPKTVSKEPAPLIVWVHGGAWRSGSKENIPVQRWLDHGFAIASVNYRLTPEASFPAQIHDIKGAIRFLKGHAKRLHIDQGKVIVAGASAGGHLAALVGVTNRVSSLEGQIGEFNQEDSSVHAIVSFYGASNLRSILSQSTEYGLSVRVPALKLLLGGEPSEKDELARLASPVDHVDAMDPPLWLIHGDADPQMPLEQSRELNSRYQAMRLRVALDVIPGGKHGGEAFFTNDRLDALALAMLDALKK